MTDTLREKALKATQLEWGVGDRWVFVPPEDAANSPTKALRHIFESVPEAQDNCEYVVAAQPTVVLSLLDEIDRLREALSKVQDAITAPVNSLAIVDTVWLPLERDPNTSIETLVDFIDAALTRSPQ